MSLPIPSDLSAAALEDAILLFCKEAKQSTVYAHIVCASENIFDAMRLQTSLSQEDSYFGLSVRALDKPQVAHDLPEGAWLLRSAKCTVIGSQGF